MEVFDSMFRIFLIIGIVCSIFLITTSESRAGSIGPVIIDGACCFPDGSCEDSNSLSCIAGFQGAETTCSTVECPQPAPTAPTVIVPTMGQWGMIFSALLLGFYAVFRLRKRKGSEN